MVSRYIPNPLLINGHKFDLRIYVAVTCFDPLRVYVYKEGLARFASEPYNDKQNNKFSHLTNYSINKNNVNYIKSDVSLSPSNSQNAENDDTGYKWDFLLNFFC